MAPLDFLLGLTLIGLTTGFDGLGPVVDPGVWDPPQVVGPIILNPHRPPPIERPPFEMFIDRIRDIKVVEVERFTAKKITRTQSLLLTAGRLVEEKVGHDLNLADTPGTLATALLERKFSLVRNLLGPAADKGLQLLDTKLKLATSLLETSSKFPQSHLELKQAKLNADILKRNDIRVSQPFDAPLLRNVGERLFMEFVAQTKSFSERVVKLFQQGSALDQHRTFVAASAQAQNKGILHRPKVIELKKFFEGLELSTSTVTSMLHQGFGPAFECNPDIECAAGSPYRTIDGSCKNIDEPRWGKSLIPFRRWLQPDYADGVEKPRSSPTLSSARVVSKKVHTNSGNSDLENKYTHMMMQWGQFVDHDITKTPSQQKNAQYGMSSACCGFDLTFRPECFPIDLPVNDVPGKTCMEFVRSVQVENYQCNAAPVEQMNEATSYLDGSQVYGSTEKDAHELREFRGGRMKYKQSGENQYLPKDPTGKSCRTPGPDPNYCFLAGDKRLNEQPNLQGMHTIFVREHNRIVKILARQCDDWDDEKLYQEARKIVGAILQKITYDEYLPIILGPEEMKKYGLNLASEGYTSHYDSKLDASVWNGFATAAFRMGHSMIRGTISTMSTSYDLVDSDKLRYLFLNTGVVLNDTKKSFDGYARGLVTDAVQKADRKMSTDVTNNLFLDNDGNFLDLAAINIQRGRDHGLPGYIHYRSFCDAGSMPKNFLELSSTHDKAAINTLEQTYSNVEDIDLFTGALTETPAPDSMLGPTFSCLLGEQFRALKYGDRFWFEEYIEGIAFTEEQLAELRKVTLSRVICDNTDTTKIQRNAFMRTNQKVSCNSFPSIDLSKWGCPGWSSWGSWGSCRGNTKTRRRYCRLGKCQGRSTENGRCPSWSSWGQWSSCRGSTKTRRRYCRYGKCPGWSTENGRCPSWSSWQPWGSCSGSTKTRTRYCRYGKCPGRSTENGRCPSWSSWGQWSTCRGGTKTRKRYCRYGKCPGRSTENGRCPSWSSWEPWGSCNGSTKTRTRYCRYGKCQGRSTENRRCQRRCTGWWWGRRCRYV